MEAPKNPQAYAILIGHPTSPPATPGSRPSACFPPPPHHPASMYKQMGLSMSPPLEFIQPIGRGPQFHFTRPQSRDTSSHPSSISGRAYATSRQESEDDEESEESENSDEFEGSGDSEEDSDEEIEPPLRRVEKPDFVLEEIDSGSDYDSDTEVVRPDQYEEAKSDKGEGTLEENGFIERFSGLDCGGDYSPDEEQRSRYIRKMKRRSAGVCKRSHSQSVGSDGADDDSDGIAGHDVGSSARRLRRRVNGPDEKRSSLIFDDLGYSNANNIAEVDEPEEYGHHVRGPPSIPSDDGFTLDELPFSVVEDLMDIESDSS